jgi:hypothetical protein
LGSFSFESPVGYQFVFSNAFRLKGSISVPSSLASAELCITGGNCTDPSDQRCHHFIDLMNGTLGPLVGLHGSTFDVTVRDQLFAGHNHVEAVFNLGGFFRSGHGEVFLVTFPQRPGTQ